MLTVCVQVVESREGQQQGSLASLVGICEFPISGGTLRLDHLTGRRSGKPSLR